MRVELCMIALYVATHALNGIILVITDNGCSLYEPAAFQQIRLSIYPMLFCVGPMSLRVAQH